MALLTASTVTFNKIPSSWSNAGRKNRGVAPLMTIPVRIDLWAFRATRISSPGLAAERIIVWLPPVVPLIRKNEWSAPYASAASSWASLMTPTGRCRQSTSSSVVRSMVKILGPTNFRKRVEIPLPLLWPGVWKDIFRLSARLTNASKRGVLYCRSGTIRKAGYRVEGLGYRGEESRGNRADPELTTHSLRLKGS